MRKYTKRLLELVDEGVLDPKTVLRDALNYMSEADVEDFFVSNGYSDDEEDDEK